jgi:serine/threonine protein kinase
MHDVETQMYPRFLRSQAYVQYAQMAQFAFSRDGLHRAAFKWLKPLGRGGYGMVHAAQKLDTGKLYAVKCMDKRMIKARHATRMIVNERDVLASVDHPFITGLQYAFQDDAEVYFVLDMKPGGDLEFYLLHLARPFTEAEVRFFAAEILLGVKVRDRQRPPRLLLSGRDASRQGEAGVGVGRGMGAVAWGRRVGAPIPHRLTPPPPPAPMSLLPRSHPPPTTPLPQRAARSTCTSTASCTGTSSPPTS